MDLWGATTDVLDKSSAGTAQIWTVVGNPWMFAGRPADFEEKLPLLQVRARSYNPSTGRFLSRDPLGIWHDSLNLGGGYSWAAGNPSNLTDPWGLVTECIQAESTPDHSLTPDQIKAKDPAGNGRGTGVTVVNEAERRQAQGQGLSGDALNQHMQEILFNCSECACSRGEQYSFECHFHFMYQTYIAEDSSDAGKKFWEGASKEQNPQGQPRTPESTAAHEGRHVSDILDEWRIQRPIVVAAEKLSPQNKLQCNTNRTALLENVRAALIAAGAKADKK